MIVDLSLGSSAARAVLVWNDSTSVSGAGGDGRIGLGPSFLHYGIGAWRKSGDVLRASEWTQSLGMKARSRHHNRQAQTSVRTPRGEFAERNRETNLETRSCNDPGYHRRDTGLTAAYSA
jgi:hypothetical protein